MWNEITVQLQLPSETLGYLTLYLKTQSQIEDSLVSVSVNSKNNMLFKLRVLGEKMFKKPILKLFLSVESFKSVSVV